MSKRIPKVTRITPSRSQTRSSLGRRVPSSARRRHNSKGLGTVIGTWLSYPPPSPLLCASSLPTLAPIRNRAHRPERIHTHAAHAMNSYVFQFFHRSLPMIDEWANCCSTDCFIKPVCPVAVRCSDPVSALCDDDCGPQVTGCYEINTRSVLDSTRVIGKGWLRACASR